MQIFAKDGDILNVIVLLEASAYDPMGIQSVAQSYRIVANAAGPTLKLVSLADKVAVVNTEDAILMRDKTENKKSLSSFEKQIAKDEMRKALPTILALMNSPSFIKSMDETGFTFDAENLLKSIFDVIDYQPDYPIFKKR